MAKQPSGPCQQFLVFSKIYIMGIIQMSPGNLTWLDDSKMSFATFPREVEGTYDGTRIWKVMLIEILLQCQISGVLKVFREIIKNGN